MHDFARGVQIQVGPKKISEKKVKNFNFSPESQKKLSHPDLDSSRETMHNTGARLISPVGNFPSSTWNHLFF